MISAAMLIARTRTPAMLLNELFTPARVHIPKAPALGLLLEHPLFGNYNASLEKTNVQLRGDSGAERDALDFSVHKEKMETFKEEFIYKEIRSREAEISV